MTEDQMVIMEILQSMAEREMVGPPGSADWLPRVSGAVAQLPWRETNLPDGRRPPQPRAAAGLMILLAKLLKSGTAAPGSVNVSWAGGVGVEWHTCKLDLEIYCEPEGTVEFGFEDRETGEQLEGQATGDNITLHNLAGRLPATRQLLK